MIDYTLHTSSSGKDATFWSALGPFLSSRAVHKELGGPVFDDARFEWVIAQEEGTVVGWGALIRNTDKNLVTMDWTYVVPEQRRRGIYSEIRKKLLSTAEGFTVRGTSKNPIIQRFYEREGFEHTGNHGSWKRYEKKGVPT